MAKRGGPRVGAGRPVGSPNKKTIERVKRAEEHIARVRESGGEFAIDVLRKYMKLFDQMAAYYQPLPSHMIVPADRQPDEAQFEKYARLVTETASVIVGYESPRLRTIVIQPMPPPPTPIPSEHRGPTLDLVANENRAEVEYAIYQRLIGGQRLPPRAT